MSVQATRRGVPTDADVAEARAGQFTAVFPSAGRAASFCQRLTGTSDFPSCRDVKLNRTGGKIVTFTADVPAHQLIQFWHEMAETVGYYGSSFGEPPSGYGRKTAYLNGRACPASM